MEIHEKGLSIILANIIYFIKEIKMAYLTKAKEQNAQNEKTGDQAKKNKVCVSLI